MANKEENVRHFLNLIKRSQRGVFKIYIGHDCRRRKDVQDVAGSS